MIERFDAFGINRELLSEITDNHRRSSCGKITPHLGCIKPYSRSIKFSNKPRRCISLIEQLVDRHCFPATLTLRSIDAKGCRNESIVTRINYCNNGDSLLIVVQDIDRWIIFKHIVYE